MIPEPKTLTPFTLQTSAVHLKLLAHGARQACDELDGGAVAADVDFVGRHAQQRACPRPPALLVAQHLRDGRINRKSGAGKLRACLLNAAKGLCAETIPAFSPEGGLLLAARVHHFAHPEEYRTTSEAVRYDSLGGSCMPGSHR